MKYSVRSALLYPVVSICFGLSFSFPTTALANSVQPSAVGLLDGKFTSSQIGNALSSNPALPHYYQSTAIKRKTYVMLAGQGAIEYGNVDDLFDLIDEISNSFVDSGSGSSSSGGTSSSSGGSGNSGIDIGANFNFEDPNFQALVNEIEQEAGLAVALTALIQTEGYAKGQLEGQFSLLLKPEILKGSLKFDFSQRYYTAALGLADPINFNPQQAVTELEAAYNLQPNDPETVFDLSSGIELTVNPSTNEIQLQFNNDSALLTRGARISEFSINYSSSWQTQNNSELYWGITPKYYVIGMSNIATRLGDISDAETLFDNIRDADLETDSNFDLNAGLAWVNQHYSVGAELRNIIDPEYSFPVVNTQGFTSQNIIDTLDKRQTHSAGTGLNLQGSLYTANHRWVLSTSIDTTEVNDPLGQKFQWVSVHGEFNKGGWLFPQTSLAYFENLKGSGLDYFAADVYILPYFNLSIASALKSTTIDGDDLPRGLTAALGVHFSF